MTVLRNEIEALYEYFSRPGKPYPFPDLSIQYADFVSWERKQYSGTRLETRLFYWRRQYDEFALGQLKYSDLPFTRPEPQVAGHSDGLDSVTLDFSLAESIRMFVLQNNFTLYMFFLSAISILLHIYSRKTRVAIWGNWANRTSFETEHLIGWFANNRLIGVTISPDSSTFDVLGQLRDTVLESSAQDIPFELLISILYNKEQRVPYEGDLYISFDLATDEHGDSVELADGLVVKAADLRGQLTQHALEFKLLDRSGRLTLAVKYDTQMFMDVQVRTLLADLLRVLSKLLSTPDSIRHFTDCVSLHKPSIDHVPCKGEANRRCGNVQRAALGSERIAEASARTFRNWKIVANLRRRTQESLEGIATILARPYILIDAAKHGFHLTAAEISGLAASGRIDWHRHLIYRANRAGRVVTDGAPSTATSTRDPNALMTYMVFEYVPQISITTEVYALLNRWGFTVPESADMDGEAYYILSKDVETLEVVWASIEAVWARIGLPDREFEESETGMAKSGARAIGNFAHSKKQAYRPRKDPTLQMAMREFARFLAAANGDPVIGARLMSIHPSGRNIAGEVLRAFGGSAVIEQYHEKVIVDVKREIDEVETRIAALRQQRVILVAGSLERKKLDTQIARERRQKRVYTLKRDAYQFLGTRLGRDRPVT
jgi:hypothetical protein